ncbi:hypothetical protein CYMTET_5521 [Cymbomonas tetramitiformis]|uniref:Uncharacterized protein n=1 Tax=Cymbomonas tetramitiformis TaxID=36881 RepID=A0AAE0LIZ9_9CHLO|nr:hypothetical protein CYMTET_5521 [Cymbomonas tetramitiformis]
MRDAQAPSKASKSGAPRSASSMGLPPNTCGQRARSKPSTDKAPAEVPAACPLERAMALLSAPLPSADDDMPVAPQPKVAAPLAAPPVAVKPKRKPPGAAPPSGSGAPPQENSACQRGGAVISRIAQGPLADPGSSHEATAGIQEEPVGMARDLMREENDLLARLAQVNSEPAHAHPRSGGYGAPGAAAVPRDQRPPLRRPPQQSEHPPAPQSSRQPPEPSPRQKRQQPQQHQRTQRHEQEQPPFQQQHPQAQPMTNGIQPAMHQPNDLNWQQQQPQSGGLCTGHLFPPGPPHPPHIAPGMPYPPPLESIRSYDPPPPAIPAMHPYQQPPTMPLDQHLQHPIGQAHEGSLPWQQIPHHLSIHPHLQHPQQPPPPPGYAYPPHPHGTSPAPPQVPHYHPQPQQSGQYDLQHTQHTIPPYDQQKIPPYDQQYNPHHGPPWGPSMHQNPSRGPPPHIHPPHQPSRAKHDAPSTHDGPLLPPRGGPPLGNFRNGTFGMSEDEAARKRRAQEELQRDLRAQMEEKKQREAEAKGENSHHDSRVQRNQSCHNAGPAYPLPQHQQWREPPRLPGSYAVAGYGGEPTWGSPRDVGPEAWLAKTEQGAHGPDMGTPGGGVQQQQQQHLALAGCSVLPVQGPKSQQEQPQGNFRNGTFGMSEDEAARKRRAQEELQRDLRAQMEEKKQREAEAKAQRKREEEAEARGLDGSNSKGGNAHRGSQVRRSQLQEPPPPWQEEEEPPPPWQQEEPPPPWQQEHSDAAQLYTGAASWGNARDAESDAWLPVSEQLAHGPGAHGPRGGHHQQQAPVVSTLPGQQQAPVVSTLPGQGPPPQSGVQGNFRNGTFGTSEDEAARKRRAQEELQRDLRAQMEEKKQREAEAKAQRKREEEAEARRLEEDLAAERAAVIAEAQAKSPQNPPPVPVQEAEPKPPPRRRSAGREPATPTVEVSPEDWLGQMEADGHGTGEGGLSGGSHSSESPTEIARSPHGAATVSPVAGSRAGGHAGLPQRAQRTNGGGTAKQPENFENVDFNAIDPYREGGSEADLHQVLSRMEETMHVMQEQSSETKLELAALKHAVLDKPTSKAPLGDGAWKPTAATTKHSPQFKAGTGKPGKAPTAQGGVRRAPSEKKPTSQGDVSTTVVTSIEDEDSLSHFLQDAIGVPGAEQQGSSRSCKGRAVDAGGSSSNAKPSPNASKPVGKKNSFKPPRPGDKGKQQGTLQAGQGTRAVIDGGAPEGTRPAEKPKDQLDDLLLNFLNGSGGRPIKKVQLRVQSA